MPLLSIVVASEGREELYYTLLSVTHQMRGMDELIILINKRIPKIRKLVIEAIGLAGFYYELPEDKPARLWATEYSSGARTIILGDGDLLVPGALDKVRDIAHEYHEEHISFRNQFVFSSHNPDSKYIEIDDSISINPWYTS